MILLMLAPLWRDTYKYLEVDARHWAGEHREILLVEEVVYRSFEREVCPIEYQHLFERDVAHKVFGQFARQ